MASIQGFFQDGDDVFVYQETGGAVGGNEVAVMGVDDTNSVFNIYVSTSPGITPTSGYQFQIDPSANGDVTLKPNGTGKVNIDYATPNTITYYGTNGSLQEVGPLTNGQIIVGSTGNPPQAANITSAGGSIVVTNGAGTINLESLGDAGGNGFIQQVSSTSSALFSTNAVIPGDDTIPQNTEGAEFLTASITPTNTNSTLYIRCEFSASADSSSDSNCTMALFQDATVNALTASSFDINGTRFTRATLSHIMTAGSTNPTTFKIRVGTNTGADLEINGDGFGTRIYGGVSNAVLYVYEIASAAGIVPQFNADSGNAQPALGVVNIVGGTGITTSAAGDTLTINSNGGLSWTLTTDASVAGAVNNGYITNRAGLVTVTIPDTAAVGDIIEVVNHTTTAVGWRVAQNAGETIYFGNTNTTTGAGGYLEATAIGDAVRLVCIVANTDWRVLSSVGNITVV